MIPNFPKILISVAIVSLLAGFGFGVVVAKLTNDRYGLIASEAPRW